MKVMVIGAHGNLGSELGRQARHAVVPIGRHEWDCLSPDAFADVDVVIHVASDLRSSITDRPSAVLESEVMVTARLLELMREHRVPRLMYLSSCAVYGTATTGEDIPFCCPVTINGQMKLLNESLIAAFCERHAIRWEAYRVFNMFGGADRFSVVNRIIEASRKRQPVTVFNDGRGVRDFVHVSDVAAILLTFLDQPPCYHHLNIGTGRPTRISELIAIAQSMDPALQVNQAASDEGIDHSVADIARLQACLGSFDFRSVVDYVKDSLSPPSPGTAA